jgi:F0F1-type ATP synthase assembly protein I
LEQKKPEKSNQKEWVRPVWFLLTVGSYVVLSLLIPVGIGYWLDLPSQFNTRPLFTLIGLGIGTIIAFLGLFIMLRRFYRQEKKHWSNKKEGSE